MMKNGLIALLILLVFIIDGTYWQDLGYKNGYKDAKKKYYPISSDVKFDINAESIQVLIDKQTGCRYAIFDKTAVTPVYNGLGEVAGCGE